MENKTIKNLLFMFGIGVAVEVAMLIISSVAFTYSWFSASVTSNEVKDQVVETGTLSLRYVDGPEIKMENIRPGTKITKTVYVANTGTLDASYNLVWQELTNEITKDELVLEATCTRIDGVTEEESGTCDGVSSTAVGSEKIKTNVSIEPNIVHKYDVTITFKEINAEQNYNQGKNFNGVLGVNEYKETTANFETDSWSDIISNVKLGNTNGYNVGDTKEIDLGDLGKHIVRIANTSTPSECSTEGFSQTACGFVIEFVDNITHYKMIDSTSATNAGGWPTTDAYRYLNNDIYNSFPSDLKDYIIDTYVVSGHGKDVTDNLISNDKLFLLAPVEMFGDISSWGNGYTYDYDKNVTRQLDYYKSIGVTGTNYSGVVKSDGYWLRSAYAYTDKNYYMINVKGGWDDSVIYSVFLPAGISPAFRLG